MDWLFPLSGFIVGMFVGLTGVGGGAFMTPVLILGFGIPPLIAVGTDLLFAAATKFVGGWTHHVQKTIDWKIVSYLAMGSVPTSLSVIYILSAMALDTAAIDSLIQTTLSLALLLTATLMVFRKKIISSISRLPIVQLKEHRPAFTILFGAFIGLVVSLSSIGAGAIGVVVISILYPHLSAVKVVGTDIAHAVPLTMIAGTGHFLIGNVDFGLLAMLLMGSIPGIYLGSRLSVKVPDRILRIVLACILFGIGIKMIFA